MDRVFIDISKQNNLQNIQEIYKLFKNGESISLLISEGLKEEVLEFIIGNLHIHQISKFYFIGENIENNILSLIEKCDLTSLIIFLNYVHFGDRKISLKLKHLLKFHFSSDTIQDINPFLKELQSLNSLQTLQLTNIKITNEFYDILKSNLSISDIHLNGVRELNIGRFLKLLVSLKNLDKLTLNDLEWSKKNNLHLKELLKERKMKLLELNKLKTLNLYKIMKNNQDLSIKMLIINDCEVRDQDIESIMFLIKNNSLKEISISYQLFSNEGLKILCNGLLKNKSVVTLNISSKILCQLKSFEQLFLQNSIIEEVSLCDMDLELLLQPFMNGLKYNRVITKVKLNNCKICDKDCIWIGECLRENKSIKKLLLNDNKIKDVGVEHILKSLKDDSVLEWLSLSSNSITEDGCLFIRYYLYNGNLTDLSFSSNNISDKGFSYLMDGLSKNQRLKSLYLYKTEINQNFIHYIREMLIYNYTIESIYVDQKFENLMEEFQPLFKRNKGLKPLKIVKKYQDINFYF